MCMKEVIDSFFGRMLWRKIIETLKTLFFNYDFTKFSQQRLFFLL